MSEGSDATQFVLTEDEAMQVVAFLVSAECSFRHRQSS